MIIAIALVAEVAIRGLAPRYKFHRMDDQFTRGYPQALNPDGSRGPPVEREKPSDAFRVLCLGDSTTFGTGVLAEATYPHRLAALLQSGGGMRVEAINAGAPGHAVKDLERWLLEHWLAYEPDLIVLAVSGNCASWAWVRRDEPAQLPIAGGMPPIEPATGPRRLIQLAKRRAVALKGAMALPNFLKLNSERALYKVGLLNHLVDPGLPLGVFLAYGWIQANLPVETRTGSLEAFDREMDSFLAAAERLNIPVVVTVMPPSFTISDRPRDNEKFVPRERLSIDFAERTRVYCGERGVPYADIAGALRAARRVDPGAKLYLQMDYSHLSPEGHGIAAAAIARAIGR